MFLYVSCDAQNQQTLQHNFQPESCTVSQLTVTFYVAGILPGEIG